MKKTYFVVISIFLGGLVSLSAQAALVSVSGLNSSEGFAAEIIGAPSDVLNGTVTNTGMQGFDEAQGVLTSAAHGVDEGGFIAAGTTVDSHMIFLNKPRNVDGAITHFEVTWTFDGEILGVMSDTPGLLEANSTSELGIDTTNYPAGFRFRGLEGSVDTYSVLGTMITVSMRVTQPGDWIRVVTASPVPVPAALPLFLSGLAGLGFMAKRKKTV